MQEVRFADGFDGPEPVAFGLGPAQLLTVVGGLLLAHALLRSSLPQPVAWPAALLIGAGAAMLGWLRLQGRPALEWAWLAARLALRPRTGLLALEGGGRSGGAIAEVPRVTAAPVRPAAAPGRRVAFFSLNGGSGRTTLATQVAGALAGRGLSVLLVDADPLNGTVALRLGVPAAGVWDRALPGAADRGAVALPGGVRVLPGCGRPLAPEAQLGHRRWLSGVLDRLGDDPGATSIFDLGPELGPLALWVLGLADEVCVVVTPSAGGVQDAYRSTEVLRRLGLGGRLVYAVNRWRGEDGALGEAMGDLRGRIVARVPYDPGLDDGVAGGGTASAGVAEAVAPLAAWAAGRDGG